jgi:hypothetical protein
MKCGACLLLLLLTEVEMQGTVFDVSRNKMYGPEGSYKGTPPVSMKK